MEIKVNVSNKFWENVLWPVYWVIWFFQMCGEKFVEEIRCEWSPRDWMDFWFVGGMVGGVFGAIICAILVAVVFEGAWFSWGFVWLWGFWVTTCIRAYNRAYEDRWR